MKKVFLLTSVLMSLNAMIWAQSNNRLSEWQEGNLDIHYICTGRGENMFYILPDGTTLLVDAGELDPTDPRTQSARNTPLYPDYTKPAHEWIVDYIRNVKIAGRETAIDYAMITHFHGDHFGEYFYGAPQSKKGDYILSGITGVYEYLPFSHLLDRGYDYPFDLKEAAGKSDQAEARFMLEYLKFIEKNRMQGLKRSTFKPGQRNQIRLLRNPSKYPGFEIRNVVANGRVWTGKGEETVTRFPDFDQSYKGPYPSENMVSCGIVFTYGKFRLAACGDIPGVPAIGAPSWQDVESAVAPVIGEVDVCNMNHHANRDAMGVNYLATLKPRVLMQSVWSSDHPGHEAFIRMTSQKVYEGDRDLFATAMLESNLNVIGPSLQEHYKSLEGHIVIRVEPGGEMYHIYVLNHKSRSRELVKTFGPYRSKGNL